MLNKVEINYFFHIISREIINCLRKKINQQLQQYQMVF